MNTLTPEEKRVIEDKMTEPPFAGEYDDFYEEGTFICRKCNAPLYSSKAKFDAGCGWPAFDADFPDSVNRFRDPQWPWSEIRCANCEAHLGHVFEGEGFTKTNTRHCVNSLSMRFVASGDPLPAVLHEKTNQEQSNSA